MTARLLAGVNDPPGLKAHLHRHGPPPAVDRRELLAEVERSGLLGRGGAGFPLARKVSAVAASGRATVVVANGCEGEPDSRKDRLLLTRAPHLVLDGLQAAARLVHADATHLVVHAGSPVLPAVRAALAERRDRVPVQVTEAARRYVASEETALVDLLNGGPGLPTFTPPRPFERGVRKRPTLVNNVETLAHLALVERYGADWYREVGDADEPGTQLLTVTGPSRTAVVDHAVLEIASGTAAGQALASAGVDIPSVQALLIGGYFGTWLPIGAATDLPLTHRDLRAVGGALGAGVLLALPHGVCPIAETARIAAYLASHSAGQCGPCLNGLPAIADALRELTVSRGGIPAHRTAALDRWLTVVPGRGACRHPDGAVRMVASALQVFAADAQAHRHGRPCLATARKAS